MIALLQSPRTHRFAKVFVKAWLIFLLVYAGIVLDSVMYPIKEFHPLLKVFGLLLAGVWIWAGWMFLSIVMPDRIILTMEEFKKLQPIRYNGYVYLMLGSDGLYKIGRTNNVKRRLVEVRKKTGDDGITLIHVSRVQDMIEYEAGLHWYFREKRIRNEWFALSDDDVSYIKSLA